MLPAAFRTASICSAPRSDVYALTDSSGLNGEITSNSIKRRRNVFVDIRVSYTVLSIRRSCLKTSIASSDSKAASARSSSSSSSSSLAGSSIANPGACELAPEVASLFSPLTFSPFSPTCCPTSFLPTSARLPNNNLILSVRARLRTFPYRSVNSTTTLTIASKVKTLGARVFWKGNAPRYDTMRKITGPASSGESWAAVPGASLPSGIPRKSERVFSFQYLIPPWSIAREKKLSFKWANSSGVKHLLAKRSARM